VFQVSATRRHVAKALRDAGTLNVISDRVRALLGACDDDDDDERTRARLAALAHVELRCVEQMLRAAFALTLCWGPLAVGRAVCVRRELVRPRSPQRAPSDTTQLDAPTADELSALERLLPVARRIARGDVITAAMREHDAHLARVHDARAAAIACLLNAPVGALAQRLVDSGVTGDAAKSDVARLLAHLDVSLRVRRAQCCA
jgi:hypothetical protein